MMVAGSWLLDDSLGTFPVSWSCHLSAMAANVNVEFA